MKKVHLCAGDIYLKGYENCDIDGYILGIEKIATKYLPPILNRESLNVQTEVKTIDLSKGNPNETTLDNYFVRPFEPNSKKRPLKVIIIDTKMNILEEWPWRANSVSEIVMINALEHFEHKDQVPHIINEAQRVLKSGGTFKFDFPDILQIVRNYKDGDHNFMMELIYGSRKNNHSHHEWGYTEKTIHDFFHKKYWEIKFRNIVVHDYPSQGVIAMKK